jgi:ClpP class serine protease
MLLINREEYEAMQAQVELCTKTGVKCEAGSGEVLSVSGSVANIEIKGLLTPERSEILDWFGVAQTVYGDISAATAIADGDDSVKEIRYNISSGGGYVDGLMGAMASIAGANKPTTALVTGMAASAAYMLASQTGEIVAADAATMLGSVGVVAGYVVNSDVKQVTNTDSQNKRPDVTTVDGMKAAQEELDDIYSVFAPLIASKRGMSVDEMGDKFKHGAMMTAKTAIERGMIDRIGVVENMTLTKPAETTAAQQGVARMDYKALKSEHADLFDAVKAEGVDQERDRVQAHLTLAEASGDMETAIEAIKAGAGLTDSIVAKHKAAQLKTEAIVAREDDNVETVATVEEKNELKKDEDVDGDELVAAAKTFAEGIK